MSKLQELLAITIVTSGLACAKQPQAPTAPPPSPNSPAKPPTVVVAPHPHPHPHPDPHPDPHPPLLYKKDCSKYLDQYKGWRPDGLDRITCVELLQGGGYSVVVSIITRCDAIYQRDDIRELFEFMKTKLESSIQLRIDVGGCDVSVLAAESRGELVLKKVITRPLGMSKSEKFSRKDLRQITSRSLEKSQRDYIIRKIRLVLEEKGWRLQETGNEFLYKYDGSDETGSHSGRFILTVEGDFIKVTCDPWSSTEAGTNEPNHQLGEGVRDELLAEIKAKVLNR